MRILSLLFAVLLSFLSIEASAGSKRLVVAFFDYTPGGIGRASFKSLRSSHFEHACWQHFVEIDGIEKAYIENLPRFLDRELLLSAIYGKASAAQQFAKSLEAEGLDGAYAFVSDASGKYVTIHGIGYQGGGVTSSASLRMPPSGLVPNSALSKALCEASSSMD